MVKTMDRGHDAHHRCRHSPAVNAGPQRPTHSAASLRNSSRAEVYPVLRELTLFIAKRGDSMRA